MEDYQVVHTEQPEVFERDGRKVCPPRDSETKSILKEPNTPITMKELGEMLSPISWGLRHCGCGYHRLMNQYGEYTKYEARRDNMKNKKTEKFDIENIRIEIKDDMAGENGNSSIYLSLYYCTIELNAGTIYIYENKNSGCSIHLYNFDNPLTEVEKLVETFPKDYEIRLKCTECGHIVTSSKPLSAYKIWADWTMLVMGRGFSTPTCQKCNENTFGDLNISTDMILTRISTGRAVKSETIFKEAEAKYKPLVRDIRDN